MIASRFTYPRSFTNDVADVLAHWKANLSHEQLGLYERLCCDFADMFAEYEHGFDESRFMDRSRAFHHPRPPQPEEIRTDDNRT